MTVASGSLGSYLLAGFAVLVLLAVLARYAEDDRGSASGTAELLAGVGTAGLLAYFSSIAATLGLPGSASGAILAIAVVSSFGGGYLLVRDRYESA